jgi:signal peptidase II
VIDPRHALLVVYADDWPVKVYPLGGSAELTVGSEKLALRPGDRAELAPRLSGVLARRLGNGEVAPPGDADDDGIPDPLDVLLGAHKAVLGGASYDDAYFSLSYPMGDPRRDKGACVDVIVRAVRNAGVDLVGNDRATSQVQRSMNRFGWVAFLALMAGVTGCDHATKRLAQTELRSGALPVWRDVVELRVAHNTDSAFSLLGGVFSADVRFWLLSVLTALATFGAALLIVRLWNKLPALRRIGGALIIGGGIGNLSDRLIRGHVIDFIHVEHWPVFNVADIAITVGVIVLLLGFELRPAARAGPA